MLEEITRLLAATTVSGSFAARRLGDAGDLQLDVKGVGPIPFPVPAAIARRLCDVARPARYGLRDQTVLDERVRAGWEIGKRQLKIEARRWQRALRPQLGQLGRDLGLPEGCTLRAELYNLLVYGPGQFFAPHQDSEKADGMIGTLVVTLPSEFNGGAFVIEHHDEKVSYRGSRDRLSFVAFYADCHHEVRPVTDGYRVVLTYNLFLEGATDAQRRPTGRPLDAMVHRVRGYFETPRPAHGPDGSSEGPPDRLVYLLDHEYTQKGLGWQRLKNGDAARAAMLRDVAARLDCEVALALADVHESWSCEDDYDGGRYEWGHRGWSDEDDDDEDDDDEDDDGGKDAEDYTLVDLFESSIELRHWISASGGRLEAISDEVSDDEVCYTKASTDLEPFKSEHEGYTGNAGNTVDRWYHRAAVVLWPRSRTFVIRAKASPAWAIREIARALAAGTIDEARAMVTSLRPFWRRVAEHEQGYGFVDQALRAAAQLDAPELAAVLLAPIALERLTPRVAPRCAALLDRYGLSWCWAQFERWASRASRVQGDRWAWIAALPELCGPLCAGGAAERLELTRRLVRSQWAAVHEAVRHHLDRLPSSKAIADLLGMSKPIVGLLATAAIAQDHVIPQTIVERLTGARGYPVRGAMHVLRTAQTQRSSAGLPALGLGALHDDCARTLTGLVGAPARAADDWSIATPVRCACALCKQLVRFLRARDQRQLAWPLAAERRAHVQEIVQSHELPVTHQTQLTGRPYTLVLTKTSALFTRETTERKTSSSDLAWLKKTARSFAPSPPRSRKRA